MEIERPQKRVDSVQILPAHVWIESLLVPGNLFYFDLEKGFLAMLLFRNPDGTAESDQSDFKKDFILEVSHPLSHENHTDSNLS